jgi:C-3',4' desaturase CrtD
VGAGVGGLTVAALLAARGLSVCLLEKETRGGGCAVTFPRSGFDFEAGPSLYSSWEPGEIHDRVFSELPAKAPVVQKANPSYLVRLPDGTDVPIVDDREHFETNLRTAFPECADAATDFYRHAFAIGTSLRRVARRLPDLRTASPIRRGRAVAPEFKVVPRVFRGMNRTAGEYLAGTSERFRRFLDVQLQIFGQRASDECAYLFAATALTLPLSGMYHIKGGASSLADVLTESIKRSGGTVRFNSSVLRLERDSEGCATGVVLLTGETLKASRAVISNLPVWDTYGKLVGLNNTPVSIRERLKRFKGWGSYVLYLGIEEESAANLPAEHILALTDWQPDRRYEPEGSQFMFGVAPRWDTRGPAGKRAVTVSTFSEASQWFSYHENEDTHEKQDQETLEQRWEMIHRSMPELGGSVEIIETATPRSFYDYTRRKFGMVGGLGQSLDVFGPRSLSHLTPVRNLLIVGDTTFPGQGIAGVTHSALVAANEITSK